MEPATMTSLDPPEYDEETIFSDSQRKLKLDESSRCRSLAESACASVRPQRRPMLELLNPSSQQQQQQQPTQEENTTAANTAGSVDPPPSCLPSSASMTSSSRRRTMTSSGGAASVRSRRSHALSAAGRSRTAALSIDPPELDVSDPPDDDDRQLVVWEGKNDEDQMSYDTPSCRDLMVYEEDETVSETVTESSRSSSGSRTYDDGDDEEEYDEDDDEDTYTDYEHDEHEHSRALDEYRGYDDDDKDDAGEEEVVEERAIVKATTRDLANSRGIDHTFVSVPMEKRFLLLYTFLKKNRDKKVMIFFSTTKSVKFHSKLLSYLNLPNFAIHSRQKREQFIDTFMQFSEDDLGVLCSTDSAGRELDIPPTVDWVIQYEPPEDPNEYILRIGRITIDGDRYGKALLFLAPTERNFLNYFQAAHVATAEYELPHVANVQAKFERVVAKSATLTRYAREAYGAFLIAYASHAYREVYNVHDLNKEAVGWSFGFVTPPSMGDEGSVMVGAEGGVGGVSGGNAAVLDSYSVASPVSGSRSIVMVDPRTMPSPSNEKYWHPEPRTKQKTWMKGRQKTWKYASIRHKEKTREETSVEAY